VSWMFKAPLYVNVFMEFVFTEGYTSEPFEHFKQSVFLACVINCDVSNCIAIHVASRCWLRLVLGKI